VFESLSVKIEERRRRLGAMAQERMILEAELRAYEDAMAIVSTASPSAPLPPALPHVSPARRRMAANWTAALVPFAEPPRDFSIDDVLQSAAAAGFNPTRGNVRSQMAAFIQRGKAERVSDGVFKLTQSGLVEIGLLGVSDDSLSEESVADPNEESAI
jgi:hypothetical protein